jgi:predicted nucleic acid-binding protein
LSKYIDTNVWLYSFTADAKYGAACKSILEDVEASRLAAVISVQVVAEAAGVLHRQFKLRDTTRHVEGILSYRLKVQPVTSEVVRLAAQFSKDFHILPYDGIHVAAAVSLGVEEVIPADKELDKAKVVTRIDPLEYARTADNP